MTKREADALCVLFNSEGVTAEVSHKDPKEWVVRDGENEVTYHTVEDAIQELNDEYNG